MLKYNGFWLSKKPLMELIDMLKHDKPATLEITSNDKEFVVNLIDFLQLSSTKEGKLTTIKLNNNEG